MGKKIFITLGSQKFQFNRLLKAVDELCERGTIEAADAIAPGCVATGMVNYKLGDDLSYGHNILQRVALTEEIASLSAFLSSDYGRYISNTPIIASAGAVLL